MTTIVDMDDNIAVITKGASEIVSALCTQVAITSIDGTSLETKEIDANERVLITNSIQMMAESGLRTIAIAYKEVSKADLHNGGCRNGELPYPDEIAPENELTLIGICGIKDPLRPEVKKAISDCKSA